MALSGKRLWTSLQILASLILMLSMPQYEEECFFFFFHKWPLVKELTITVIQEAVCKGTGISHCL